MNIIIWISLVLPTPTPPHHHSHRHSCFCTCTYTTYITYHILQWLNLGQIPLKATITLQYDLLLVRVVHLWLYFLYSLQA
jgi:hypothetical protein